jgi:hypothetical protein
MMLEVTSFKIQFKSKTLKTCHNSINCLYLKWQAVCQAHYTKNLYQRGKLGTYISSTLYTKNNSTIQTEYKL